MGALAAVLSFEIIVVLRTQTEVGTAMQDLLIGIALATVLGLAGGWGISRAFRRAWVPEYMKVPVLFVVMMLVFALSDSTLHETGLLAVTLMGIWIANANLPSYAEIRGFKEHATVLLVSGVFIILAANMTMETLQSLTWQALVFVLAVALVARPVSVLAALALTDVPWRERLLVAFTGPRGVVLVAVAGLFGERLVSLGVEDASRIAPLAFALVAATVVLHGFTLTPLARALGLVASDVPGVVIVGGSQWSVALAQAFDKLGLPVMIADPNRSHLRSARDAGLNPYFGDILSESAEQRLDLMPYEKVIVATDNDAYNTLVATDLAPEFGRENVFQIKRAKEQSARHSLPPTLGGQKLGAGDTFNEAQRRIWEGWSFRVTRLSEEFTLEDWRAYYPEAVVIAERPPQGVVRLLDPDTPPRDVPENRILAMVPKDARDSGPDGDRAERDDQPA